MKEGTKITVCFARSGVLPGLNDNAPYAEAEFMRLPQDVGDSLVVRKDGKYFFINTGCTDFAGFICDAEGL